MPSRWRVTLPGINPASVRLEHLHAVICGWLDDSDEAHRAQAKPYSVSPPIAAHGGTAVEIGTLTDQAADRLHQRAATGARVRLGSAWSTIHTPPHQIASTLWQALTTAGSSRAWCLRLLTPTTFRRRNAFTPTPALAAILGSLRRIWRTFAPADLSPLVLDLSSDPVWLTYIDVTSHVVRINERVVSGFIGRLRFVCDASDETATAVDALVRLAEYSGVGAYTTRGFGLAHREPTWAAAPPRQPSPPPTTTAAG